jgi:hypothetical protein
MKIKYQVGNKLTTSKLQLQKCKLRWENLYYINCIYQDMPKETQRG